MNSSTTEIPSQASAQQSERELLTRLLTECAETDASDVHLRVAFPPFFRVQGLLSESGAWPALDRSTMQSIVDALLQGIDREPLTRTGSVDGAISAADGTRYRFNVYRRQGELSVALRKLEDRFRSLAELGLPDSLSDLCDLPDGLVLVAGPTGSGKSTTLATLIHQINTSRPGHIITIEDPIEYLHPPDKSLVNQRQVGTDASSFYEALVSSLRQDPDVVLVGEIREIETIRTAITASETGHLVFSTVHAGDCVGAIERLVSVFPAEEQAGIRRQLSLVLRAVVTQHLLVADGSAVKDRGRERVVVSEVLRATPAVANLIATGKTSQVYSAMESGSAIGMQTLEESLAALWTSNRITESSAMALARNPDVVRERASRIRRGK